MKLSQKKIKWIIKRKQEGMSSREIAMAMKVSKRRVNQIWKLYRETGKIPEIGKNLGRPKKPPLSEKEKEVIIMAKKKYKLGARRLEVLIERDHGIHIPHNRIHQFLLQEGLAREEKKKKRKRKPTLYQRVHSMSAAHMDWHDGKNGEKVCAILDDRSRKILACGEFERATEENSIKVFLEAMREWEWVRPLREIIIDNGSHFGAHRTDEKGEWDSEFKRIVLAHGVKIIRTRVRHPQTNGKIEKWAHLYDLYRGHFQTLEDFIKWYNSVRTHEGADPSGRKTPDDVFWENLPTECILGLACKMFGW